jgi:peptidoglycan/LPS O-acetylase OafA/YrhL
MATIVTIILVVLLHQYILARGLTEADYTAFGQRVGAIIGPFGGTLYVFIFARRLMPRIASGFVAHGIVVALAAIALSIAGSIAGHHGVPAGYVLASALKIIAGASAAYLYERSVVRNRMV